MTNNNNAFSIGEQIEYICTAETNYDELVCATTASNKLLVLALGDANTSPSTPPNLVCRHPFNTRITSLCNIDDSTNTVIFAGTASGDVKILSLSDQTTISNESGIGVYDITPQDNNNKDTWSNFHNGSITQMKYKYNHLASVGDDGMLRIMRLNLWGGANQPNVVYNGIDECGIEDVDFITSNEIVTCSGSFGSPIKLWDLRVASRGHTNTSSNAGQNKNKNIHVNMYNECVTSFNNNNGTGTSPIYHCVCSHPTRPELIASGTSDGYVVLWDLRRPDVQVLRCVPC